MASVLRLLSVQGTLLKPHLSCWKLACAVSLRSQFLRLGTCCIMVNSRCVLFKMTVGRTMKALVVLRGLAIEWVLVKAFHEDFSLENGKVSEFV